MGYKDAKCNEIKSGWVFFYQWLMQYSKMGKIFTNPYSTKDKGFVKKV